MSFECDTQQAQPQYDSKSPRKGLEIWTKTTRQRGDGQSHIDLWWNIAWNNRIILCLVSQNDNGGETNCRNKCVWNTIGTSLCPANRTLHVGQFWAVLLGNMIFVKTCKNCKKKTWNSVMVILDWWANLDEQMLSYMCIICETVKQQLGGQDECNSKAGNCAIARRAKWNSTLELLRDSGHCHLCNNPKLGFKSTASKFKQL